MRHSGIQMIELTDYIHEDADWLATRKTEVRAELGRLRAGQAFSLPGGRQSTRIHHEALVKELAAINYAIKYQSGDVIDSTVADLSQETY